MTLPPVFFSPFNRKQGADFPLAGAALVLFAAPLLAMNAALAVSIQHGLVPECFPYLDGKISVSRAGRNPPASYFFKPAVVLCGILGAFYWPHAARRLAELNGRQTMSGPESAMAWLGAAGAGLLIVYAVALGNPGDLYRFMRRVGIYAYFAGVSFAQILFALNMRDLARSGKWNLVMPTRMLWAALAAMLFLAGAVLPSLYFATGSKSFAERTVEWNYLLPMHLFFLASAAAWRKLAPNVRKLPA